LHQQPGPILGIYTARDNEQIRALFANARIDTIGVGELAADEARRLIHSRLADGEPADALAQIILEKTGGNPLFIREMIGALVEQGVLQADTQASGRPLRWIKSDASIQIPTTIEGVVASRIDSLPPAEKSALIHASLIGLRFKAEVVDRITGHATAPALHTMVSKGLLRYDQPDDQFSFVNGLIQEISANAIPKEERKQLHQRIAARLVSHPSYRPGFDDGSVARHLEAAGDRQLAAQTYLAAARNARSRHAEAEALRLFDKVVELLPPSSPSAFEVHVEREDIYRLWGLHKQRMDEIRELLRLAQEHNDERSNAIAHCRLAHVQLDGGEPRGALPPLKRALVLADKSDSPDIAVEAIRLEALANQALGRYPKAVELLRGGLDRCGSHPSLLPNRAALLVTLGEMLAHTGDLRGALSAYVEALLIYHRLSNTRAESATLERMGQATLALGEIEEALAHYQQALSISRKSGDPTGMAERLGNIGYAYMALGSPERAVPFLGKAVQIYQALGSLSGSCASLITMGQIHLQAGDLPAAEHLLQQGLDLAAEAKNIFQRIRGLVYLAHASIQTGNQSKGLGQATEGLDLARSSTIPVGQVHALLAQARAHLMLEDEVASLAASDEAAELVSNRPVEGMEEYFCYQMEILTALDQEAKLVAVSRQARRFVERRIGKISSSKWRERYTSRRDVAAILRLSGPLWIPATDLRVTEKEDK
jgi:tetratricopeptide (TPR) repeat protein